MTFLHGEIPWVQFALEFDLHLGTLTNVDKVVEAQVSKFFLHIKKRLLLEVNVYITTPLHSKRVIDASTSIALSLVG